MAFSGEVQHGAGAVLGQQGIDQGTVTQVAVHKRMADIALQARQGFGVARIGQFVEVDEGLVSGVQPVEDKVRADEAGTASHKKGHLYLINLVIKEV